MKNIILFLLLFVSSVVYAAAPVISCTPSRTSGIAPLGVFLDCSATTDDSTSYPFHDLFYKHSFGDNTAGKWLYGANPGSSRNIAYGPEAAHVFETAGTYKITSIVCDTPTSCSTQINTIVVTSPDDINGPFAGVNAANTICVAVAVPPTAGVGGCPAGATVHQTSNFNTAIGYISGTKKRLLFNKGETWTVSTTTLLAVTGPGIIGAYGTGANPVIQITADTLTTLGFWQDLTATWGDWRIMDLEIDGQSRANGVGIQSVGTGSQFTFVRLNIHHMRYPITFSDDALNLSNFPIVWDQIFFFEVAAHHTVGGSGANAMYVSAERLAILGGTYFETTAGEFPMRLPYVGKGVVSNVTNYLPASDKAALTLRSTTTLLTNVYSHSEHTNKVVVSDSKFTSASANNLGIGPASPQVIAEDMHDVIIERNYILNGPTIQSSIAILYNFSDASIRNNIISFTDTNVPFTLGILVAKNNGDLQPTPDRIRIDNNTFFSNVNVPFWAVTLSSASYTFTNLTAKNNLAWAPLNATHQFVINDGISQTLTQTTNSTDSEIFNNNPAFEDTTTTAAGFRLQSGSYAVTNGTANFPSSYDDFWHCQDKNNANRRGAAVPRIFAKCKTVAGP